MFKQGKNKILKVFTESPELMELIDIFYEKDADKCILNSNECKIIASLYLKNYNKSLNECRFDLFVIKQST